MRFGRIRASLCAALLVLSALPVLASGRRAPDLKLENLQGQARKLSALRGHIVVVNFWATWCGPCQEELPRLSKLAQQWAGKDVRFVAVSIDDRKDQAKIDFLLIAVLLAAVRVRPGAAATSGCRAGRSQ